MAARKDKDDNDGPPASNDAYTGMLAIALFALIGGCVLLYLDYSQYPDSKGPAVPKAPAPAAPDGVGGGAAAPKAAAPQPAGAQPVVAQPKDDAAPKN